MIVLCQFHATDDGWECQRCRWPLTGVAPDQVQRRCVPVKPIPRWRAWIDARERRFITEAELIEDSARLGQLMPPDVTRIAGVARSGITPASVIAKRWHLPLDILDQTSGRIIPAGHGWRGQEGFPVTGLTLVVDDTVMTGNSMEAVRPIAEKHYHGRFLLGAVYCNPEARTKPDLHAVSLPWPHLLEWNLFNSVLVPSCAFDLDGILCDDCPPGCDDDGGRYLEWMRSVRPLYPVRKTAIPLIVTARLEKYRQPTVEWLSRWGVKFQRLVMGPWSSLRDRNQPGEVSKFKAHHYSLFLKTVSGLKPHLFVESCPIQAREIADLTGADVLCPGANRCFP